MSWEEMSRKTRPCPCGKGQIESVWLADDWGRSETRETMLCDECRDNYEYVLVSDYERARMKSDGMGWVRKVAPRKTRPSKKTPSKTAPSKKTSSNKAGIPGRAPKRPPSQRTKEDQRMRDVAIERGDFGPDECSGCSENSKTLVVLNPENPNKRVRLCEACVRALAASLDKMK